MEQEQGRREKQARGRTIRGRPSRIERHALAAGVGEKENIEVGNTDSAGIFKQEHGRKTEYDDRERPGEDDLNWMLGSDWSRDKSKSQA